MLYNIHLWEAWSVYSVEFPYGELFIAGIKLRAYVIENIIFHMVGDDRRLWWTTYLLRLKKSELLLECRR